MTNSLFSIKEIFFLLLFSYKYFVSINSSNIIESYLLNCFNDSNAINNNKKKLII